MEFEIKCSQCGKFIWLVQISSLLPEKEQQKIATELGHSFFFCDNYCLTQFTSDDL